MYKVQDPKYKQKTLIENYKNQFKTDITAAQSLVEDDSDITLKSEVINQVSTVVGTDNNNRGLQSEWFTKVIDELQLNQDTFFQWVNNFVSNRTVYNNALSYAKNDIVVYDSNEYLCLKDTTVGILPTNVEYWLLLPITGDKGVVGLGVTYRGEWYKDNFSQYDMVKIVTNEDSRLYVANADTTNQDSPIDNSEWTLVATQNGSKISVVNSISDVKEGINIVLGSDELCTFVEYNKVITGEWNIETTVDCITVDYLTAREAIIKMIGKNNLN